VDVLASWSCLSFASIGSRRFFSRTRIRPPYQAYDLLSIANVEAVGSLFFDSLVRFLFVI
jgi:hypothetical protein